MCEVGFSIEDEACDGTDHVGIDIKTRTGNVQRLLPPREYIYITGIYIYISQQSTLRTRMSQAR